MTCWSRKAPGLKWRTEIRPSAQKDLQSIYRYLAATHQEAFGHDHRSAQDLARRRIVAIRDNIPRIAIAPHRGARVSHGERTYRHLTIDRAVYWFTLDEDRRVVSVEGVFFGGQDHLGRMLTRLTEEGGA